MINKNEKIKNGNVAKELEKLDNQVKWILIAGVLFLLGMPIIVTQFNFLFDFSQTGQIGDTIGGTTAPIIGAVSALLIYFSFRAQINANRIIQQQIDEQKNEELAKKNFEHQMERYKHLKEYLNSFKYATKKRAGYVNYLGTDDSDKHGSEAISNFLRSELTYPREISEFKNIISFFFLILNNIKPEGSNADSKFIFNLIDIQFHRNIWDSNEELIEDALKESKFFNERSINIYFNLKKIHIELIKYRAIWPD